MEEFYNIFGPELKSVTGDPKKIEEVLKITDKDISDALGGLPISHMHCSNLSMEAFRNAVEDYKLRNK